MKLHHVALVLLLPAVACGDSAAGPEEFVRVESPDDAPGIWSPGPPLPWPVPVQSGVEFDSAGFVIGPVDVDGARVGVVLRLDTQDRWSLLPFVPFPGDRFDLFVLADSLFALGRDQDRSGLFVWSLPHRAWLAREPPVGGGHGAAAGERGRLFLAGGIPDSTTYVYAAATGEWKRMPPAPTPRIDPIAFVADGLVLLFGISRDGDAPLEVLDTRAGVWTSRGPTPIRETEPHTARLGDGLHFLGGFPEGSDRAGIGHRVLHLSDLTWETLSPIPTPRAGGAGLTFMDAICLIAGEAPPLDLTPRPTGTVDKYRERD